MKIGRNYMVLAGVGFLGIALAVTTALENGRLSGKEDPKTTTGSQPRPAATVRAEGRVTCYPGAQVVVASEMAGLVVHMPAEENQGVEKGTLLAELKSDQLRASLAEAQARVTEVEAELSLAEQELQRNRQLLTTRTISQQELDRSVRDVAVVSARRLSAAATVARLEAMLSQTRVLAPIKGVVLRRHVQPGEGIEAYAPVATVADLSRVRVEAEIDEYDAAGIRAGQGAKITAEGFPGQSWKGTVEEVPGVVVDKGLQPRDPARPVDVRVLLAKIALSFPTPLKLGQRVEVEISSDSQE